MPGEDESEGRSFQTGDGKAVRFMVGIIWVMYTLVHLQSFAYVCKLLQDVSDCD